MYCKPSLFRKEIIEGDERFKFAKDLVGDVAKVDLQKAKRKRDLKADEKEEEKEEEFKKVKKVHHKKVKKIDDSHKS